MEILLLTLSIICLLGGLAGAFLPTPGPPLSLLGIFLLHWSGYVHFSSGLLWSFSLITLIITVLGGTRYGAVGAVVGILVGLLFLPGIGLFLGTFLGAFLGEMFGGAQTKSATKAAIGSFIGFITGIVMKVILCLAMIIFSVVYLFKDTTL